MFHFNINCEASLKYCGIVGLTARQTFVAIFYDENGVEMLNLSLCNCILLIKLVYTIYK